MKVERIQTTTYECAHCQNHDTQPKGCLPDTCVCGRRSWRATGQHTEYATIITDNEDDYLLAFNPEKETILVKKTQTNEILAALNPYEPLNTPLEIIRITDCPLSDAEKIVRELLNTAALDDQIQLEQTANYYQLAKEYTDQKPVYYDETKLWWEWSEKEKRWVKTDETNLLVRISRALPNPLLTLKASKKHELLEALRRVAREKKPKEPPTHWVQYADKTYNLKTGELTESSPEYFNKNTIPWRVGHTTETPILDKLFKEWVVGDDQDESWVDTLYEIIAYCTLRAQPAQRIFALIGAGANGKGTFLKVVNKFLGHDNTFSTDLQTLTGNRFAASDIYGKLTVFLSEADEKSLKDVNQLKRLTGDDLEVRYEFKGKGAFSDISYATCIMACNELPLPKNQDAAYYRRWLVVDFPHRFGLKRDVLAEIPDREYEALAAKCIEKSRKILKTKTFTNEGTLAERTKRYDERADPVQRFMNQYCVVDDPDASISFSEFCNHFNSWVETKNKRRLDHRRIAKFVRERGFEVKRQTYVVDEHGTRSTRYELIGVRWAARMLGKLGRVEGGEKWNEEKE